MQDRTDRDARGARVFAVPPAIFVARADAVLTAEGEEVAAAAESLDSCLSFFELLFFFRFEEGEEGGVADLPSPADAPFFFPPIAAL